MRAWFVSVFGEVGDKLYVSEDSGLGKPVHPFHDSHQNISIVDQVQEFVLDNDGFQYGGDVNTHVFPNLYASIFGGDDAVE
jgi:hypothetical protein